MIKKYGITAMIATVLLSLFSCQKATEGQVIGKWKIDGVGAPYERPGAYWQFEGNGAITLYLNPENPTNNGVAKGDWKIKKTMTRRFIEIKITETIGEMDPHSPIDMTGKWRIDFLNSREMGIVRVDCPTCPTEGQSYIRRDFVKIR
ncbi:MAG: hypothetical protein LBU90_00870 [Bacteroidales bacterium]|jgi:hypothetical protein|nr:hypothetical protein [Bacteroidales bacterium]